MDIAPDIKRPGDSSRHRTRTEMEKSFDTLQVEMAEFWNTKTISGLAWCMFWMINISNISAVIYHAAPGWGWTPEVSGGWGLRTGVIYLHYNKADQATLGSGLTTDDQITVILVVEYRRRV